MWMLVYRFWRGYENCVNPSKAVKLHVDGLWSPSSPMSKAELKGKVFSTCPYSSRYSILISSGVSSALLCSQSTNSSLLVDLSTNASLTQSSTTTFPATTSFNLATTVYENVSIAIAASTTSTSLALYLQKAKKTRYIARTVVVAIKISSTWCIISTLLIRPGFPKVRSKFHHGWRSWSGKHGGDNIPSIAVVDLVFSSQRWSSECACCNIGRRIFEDCCNESEDVVKMWWPEACMSKIHIEMNRAAVRT